MQQQLSRHHEPDGRGMRIGGGDVLTRCQELVASGHAGEAAVEVDRALSAALSRYSEDVSKLLATCGSSRQQQVVKSPSSTNTFPASPTPSAAAVERDTCDVCRYAAASMRIRLSGSPVLPSSCTGSSSSPPSSSLQLAVSSMLYRATSSISQLVEEFALHIADRLHRSSTSKEVIVPAPLALLCVQAMISAKQMAQAGHWLKNRVIEPLADVIASSSTTSPQSASSEEKNANEVVLQHILVRGGLKKQHDRKMLQDALYLLIDCSASVAATTTSSFSAGVTGHVAVGQQQSFLLRSVAPALSTCGMSDAAVLELFQLESRARSIRSRSGQSASSGKCHDEETLQRRQRLLESSGGTALTKPVGEGGQAQASSSSVLANGGVSSSSSSSMSSRAVAIYQAARAVLLHPVVKRALGAAICIALLGVVVMLVRRFLLPAGAATTSASSSGRGGGGFSAKPAPKRAALQL